MLNSMTRTVLAALTLVSATHCFAGRPVDHRRLQPVAVSLHRAAIDFEAKAQLRPFPRHEQHYIRLMTQKACRLADGIRGCSHYGRIKADTNVMRAFVRVVDKRLNRHCAHRDPQLMRCWTQVKHDLAVIECGLDGCHAGCVLHHPPHHRHVVPIPAPQPVPHRHRYQRPLELAPIQPVPQPQVYHRPYIEQEVRPQRRNDTVDMLLDLVFRVIESRRPSSDVRRIEPQADPGWYNQPSFPTRRF